MLMLSTLPWRLVLVILTHALISISGVKASNKSSGEALPSLSPSTCPVGTINYITHTLAQQCLKGGWTTSTTLSDATVPLPSISASISTTKAATTTSTTTNISAITSTSASPSSLLSTSLTKSNVLSQANTTSAHSASFTDTSTTSSAIHFSSSILEPTIPTSSAVEADQEIDSSLDSAKFLSFEDWKQQNLAQAGQSVENLAARSNNAQTHERRRPENLNGLESLGEEAEIDIDFGFGNGPSAATDSVAGRAHKEEVTLVTSNSQASPPALRNKDAGKTCKERFNYASFDCAANIIKTNPRCKSSNSVLVENKDSYMLNECSISNKFLIVELCDDILVDTIVIANFEFFSSMFRTFKISVSDRFPVKAEKWKDLGTYEARNSRDIQAFLIENPLIWARYLRVEFLTHYGSEYYCPISLLRVHGTTMMEEFRHQEQIARGELDDDDEEDVVETLSKQSSVVSTAVDISAPEEKDTTAELVNSVEKVDKTKPSSSSIKVAPSIATPASPASSAKGPVNTTSAATTLSIPSSSRSLSVETEAVTTTSTVYYKTTLPAEKLIETSKVPSAASTTSRVISSNSTISNSSAILDTTSTVTKITTSAQSPQQSSNNTLSVSKPLTTSSSIILPAPVSVSYSSVAPAVSPIASSPSPSTTTSTTPTSTPPATQESFFKSIHKRLTALESNATLSLQYIESQSSLLRDAFASASKRQLARTSTFLDTLNTTVSTELLRFKAEYDQLWQSTVLELSNQRDEGRRERELLAEHVKMLAEEVIGQKRIVAVQTGLMMLCLGAIVFGQLGIGKILGNSGTNASPLGYVGKMKGSPGNRSRSGYSVGKLESPGGTAGDESGGSAYGAVSRPRWWWDSPFRSSVGPTSSVVSSSARPRKPLPQQRRVVSDGALVSGRMKMHSLDEEDEEAGNMLLSPVSPASVSGGAEGTEGISDVDVGINDRQSQGEGLDEAGTEQQVDAGIPSLTLTDADEILANMPENVLVQVRSAPTTPMV